MERSAVFSSAPPAVLSPTLSLVADYFRSTTLWPPDGPHLPARSSAAKELIAAIGFQPDTPDTGRHLELLQDLTRPRIDSPQIAFVTFPSARAKALHRPR